MQRRAFVYGGIGALAACSRSTDTARDSAASTERHRWRMVTSWPPNFPGFGESAQRLAKRIGDLSGGRLEIDVYAAGELMPAFEVFDAVSRGSMQMGHSSPTYWRGVLPAAQFFSSVPFGMLPSEHKAWMYHGGGLALWREVYGVHGITPFMAGNTGAQMGGWFKREINSLGDLAGLKMRIPGLGAEVIKRAGAVPVNLPGTEIFTSLATGVIDATEWNGPFNDMAFGLHEVAEYYYYPGWHEPCGVLECLVSTQAYETLSPELQDVITTACMAENEYVATEFNARNQQALITLVERHGVKLRRFPDDVLGVLRDHSSAAMEALAANDVVIRRVYDAYRAFAATMADWHEVSEGYYTRVRRA
jgi:TRAP-type mannitol/chloroaromatic compound transport system substrate-binding protein